MSQNLPVSPLFTEHLLFTPEVWQFTTENEQLFSYEGCLTIPW